MWLWFLILKNDLGTLLPANNKGFVRDRRLILQYSLKEAFKNSTHAAGSKRLAEIVTEFVTEFLIYTK